MNPLVERALLSIVPPLGYAYIRLLRLTLRVEYRGQEVLTAARREPGSYILAFWHSRWVMMPYGYPDRKLAVLSSRHRDSEMLARVLRRFGLEVVRGSTTRGGAAGLRAAVRKVAAGYDLGFTPDGPRGPRRRVKAGVIAASRMAGAPIIPVAFSARRARRLRTWDRTLVPWWFARGLFLYGESLQVPREADRDEQERLRKALEAELDRITDLADREVGLEPEESRPTEGPA